MRILLCMLLLSWSISGCQLIAPDVHSPTDAPSLGEPFTLAFDQAVVVEDTNLRLSFEDVVGESRCALGTVCIWEGEATIAVQATIRADTTQLQLTVPGPRPVRLEDNTPFQVGPYVVQLLELNPYPQEGSTIPETSYRAVLRVE